MIQKGDRIVLVSETGYSPKHDAFLKRLIDIRIALFCVVGQDCRVWEEVMDELCVGDGVDPIFIQTSSHPYDILQEVIEFAEAFTIEINDRDVKIIEICAEKSPKHQDSVIIYVRDCPMERLLAWFEAVIGPLNPPVYYDSGMTIYHLETGSLTIQLGIEGGSFVEMWFNSSCSPWATDLDFARQAAKELGHVVRCCPGWQYPESPWWSDDFIEIVDGKECIVTNW